MFSGLGQVMAQVFASESEPTRNQPTEAAFAAFPVSIPIFPNSIKLDRVGHKPFRGLGGCRRPTPRRPSEQLADHFRACAKEVLLAGRPKTSMIIEADRRALPGMDAKRKTVECPLPGAMAAWRVLTHER